MRERSVAGLAASLDVVRELRRPAGGLVDGVRSAGTDHDVDVVSASEWVARVVTVVRNLEQVAVMGGPGRAILRHRHLRSGLERVGDRATRRVSVASKRSRAVGTDELVVIREIGRRRGLLVHRVRSARRDLNIDVAITGDGIAGGRAVVRDLEAVGRVRVAVRARLGDGDHRLCLERVGDRAARRVSVVSKRSCAVLADCLRVVGEIGRTRRGLVH